MSPSHATKGKTRYRYYISNEAIDGAEQQLPIRLPAEALESAAIGAVVKRLDEMAGWVGQRFDAEETNRAEFERSCLREKLVVSRTAKRREVLLAIDLRLVVHSDRIEASCNRAKLLELLKLPYNDGDNLSDRLAFEVAASLRRRGHELKLRVDAPSSLPGKTDPNLVRLVVRANIARQQLANPEFAIASQARRELARLARASYLAPDIVTAIFEGRTPAGLKARRLERLGNLPICWQEQRRLLGFA